MDKSANTSQQLNNDEPLDLSLPNRKRASAKDTPGGAASEHQVSDFSFVFLYWQHIHARACK